MPNSEKFVPFPCPSRLLEGSIGEADIAQALRLAGMPGGAA